MAKLLIVDDESHFIDMLQIRLEANGYEVIAAYNGEEGLAKAKSESPDLIILDIRMPVMDGHEMLKKLRGDEQIKNIPVILCSAKAQKDTEDIGQKADADDYIKKPFEASQFLAKIETLLNKSS